MLLTEKILHEFLKEIYLTTEYQKEFEWCKNWTPPEETQKKDIFKMYT